jgi:hypothetical protein
MLYLQNYSRDLFLFLYFLLIIVAAMTSFKVHQDKSALTGKSILYLNRHQTEEWKGWMQVLIILFIFCYGPRSIRDEHCRKITGWNRLKGRLDCLGDLGIILLHRFSWLPQRSI